MRTRLTAVLIGVSFMTLLASCAQPPTAAVEAAKERLEAVAAEGAIYASEQYGAAQDLVAQLDAELEEQEGGFAPFRSYDQVGELAASVETAAGEVQQAIDTEQQRLRAEAGRIAADAKAALSDARQSLEDIPEDDASTLQSDLTAVESALGRVDTFLADGQLAEAHSEADTALQTATRVNASIAELQATRQEAQEAAVATVARAAQGDVSIPRAVLVDGKPLAAGAYQVRLSDEAGDDTRWIEFVRDGTVAGRGLAIAIPDAEIGDVAKSPPPRNEARVAQLRSGEYVRLWLNRGGTNYLVYMPTGSR